MKIEMTPAEFRSLMLMIVGIGGPGDYEARKQMLTAAAKSAVDELMKRGP